MRPPARVIDGEVTFETRPAYFRQPSKKVHILGGGKSFVESADPSERVGDYHLKLTPGPADVKDVILHKELKTQHLEEVAVGPGSHFRKDAVIHSQGDQFII
jgi:hypothetical protein